MHEHLRGSPHTFMPGSPLHTCYCPSCNNYSIEAGPSVVCVLQQCPQCGSTLRDRSQDAVQVSQQAATLVQINDQPIAASFFGQGQWLTDFITPKASDVQELYKNLTRGLTSSMDRISACARWVANQVRYVQFVKGKIWIEGKSSVQTDLWMSPSMTIQTRVGNCLSGDTKIIVVNPKGHYEIKAIQDLENCEDYQVVSYNFQRQKVELKPILNWFDNGQRETMRVRFNNGETVSATPDHIFYTYQNGQVVEITLNAALQGHCKVINIKRIPSLGTVQRQGPIAVGHKPARGGYRYSYEHLWTVGHYLAEGNSSDDHVRIANDDPKLRDKLCSFLDFLHAPYSRSNLPHSNYVTLLHRREGQKKDGLRNLKEGLRLLGHTAAEKTLTSEFLSLCRPALVAIMDGYCDGDSYLPTRIKVRRKFDSKHQGRFHYHYKRSILLQHSTVSQKLADQLKLIHFILGRPLHSRNGASYGAGRNPLPRWTLTEHLRPSYKRGPTVDSGELKIKETVNSKIERVYDIEVADNHNFMLASGVLVHNCAVKSFLLTSLLRNELTPDQVYCTMGNLYNGKPGGHAWVALKLADEGEQIMETTVPSAPPMVPAEKASRYESVHYFNDEQVFAVEGRTQLVPMAAVYSTWLGEYLNQVYIESHRR